jgi:hypothetical protein
MWCYFHVLLVSASAVRHANELCSYKSVTPAFDCLAAKALPLIAPLSLVLN